MKNKLKNYRFLLFVISLILFALIFWPPIGKQAITFSGKNFINFIFMLAPVFVCIGLLDVWVEKESMIKIMGKKSGFRGIVIAYFMGVVTAVPLYALLPIAGMLLKKESKISNVLIFICSSASIRIPLLLFEVSSMGWKFTATRFVMNLFVVIIITFTIEKMLTAKDKQAIYDNADNL